MEAEVVRRVAALANAHEECAPGTPDLRSSSRRMRRFCTEGHDATTRRATGNVGSRSIAFTRARSAAACVAMATPAYVAQTSAILAILAILATPGSSPSLAAVTARQQSSRTPNKTTISEARLVDRGRGCHRPASHCYPACLATQWRLWSLAGRCLQSRAWSPADGPNRVMVPQC